MSKYANPKSILITGASSGIGAALARCYAMDGVTLTLTGRDGSRLGRVAEAARKAGAEVHPVVCDVAERAAMEDLIGVCQARAPLDLVIANAGISGGTAGPQITDFGAESADQVRRIFGVNLDGLLNTILPARDIMAAQGHGQLALVSSIAGFRGLPTAPAYAASKAAVKAYGEGIRMELAPAGIGVSVICPGFVTSRMTDKNNFPMPFKMTAERAAAIIRRGLAKNKPRIVFPFPMYLGAWLLAALPPSWTDGRLARAPKKS